MIYPEQYIWDPKGIFHGQGFQSIGDWRSKIPSLQTMSFFTTLDPAYKSMLAPEKRDDSSLISLLALESVVGGLRNCIARISTIWGYFQSATRYVSDIFENSVNTAAQALETVSDVLDSGALQAAVNSIGWIPIVGWIIKIIYEVANLIVDIVRTIQEKRAANDAKELNKIAQLYALPIAQWSPDIDTFMGQELQRRLTPGDADFEWIIRPRYPAKNPNDFRVYRQRFDGKPVEKESIDGYLIIPEGAQGADGLGLVPGTSNIHASIEVDADAGRSVRDLGDFFTTTQIMANSLWGQAIKGDSGITFAFDTDRVSDAWINYVQAAVEYAYDAMGGWTMIHGRFKNSDEILDGASITYEELMVGGLKYKCSKADLGKAGCRDADSKGTPKNSGKWKPIPGDGHRDVYIDHLYDLFDWSTSNGEILFDTIRPVQSLEKMKQRQIAMLDSHKCLYLDDAGPRFRAITGNGSLRSKWMSNVQALFESGDWKTVDYRDVVPGGDVDNAIRQRLLNMGTTPEKYFNLDKNGMGAGKATFQMAAAPPKTVLGDPKPPDMPNPVDIGKISAVARAPIRLGGGTTRKKSSAAPLLLGAAAIGLLMMRGRK